MLETVIREAEAIFIAKVPELSELQQRIYPNGVRRVVHTFSWGNTCLPLVTEIGVKAWLQLIKHDPHGRHKPRSRNHATAYGRSQRIIYNPHFVARCDHRRLLDLVLHEMGHLFTFHFFWEGGHGTAWISVGRIVGYATVGATTERKRSQMPTFAEHSGTVAPVEKINSTVVSKPTIQHSLVTSPVKRVWAICNLHWREERKVIIDICVKAGVNPNTAATQYAAWKRANRFWFVNGRTPPGCS